MNQDYMMKSFSSEKQQNRNNIFFLSKQNSFHIRNNSSPSRRRNESAAIRGNNLQIDDPSIVDKMKCSKTFSNKCSNFHQENNNNNSEKDLNSKLDDIMKRIRFKNYIQKLLMLSKKRIYRLLNYQQIKLINDQSSHFQNTEEEQNGKSYLKRMKLNCNQLIPKFLQTFLAQFPIFMPNNPFLDLWQLLKISSVIVCLFYYLVSFSFGIPLEQLLSPAICYGCQFCLAVDVLVYLNTAIYLKGHLTTSRRQILQQYKTSKTLYSDIIQITSFLFYCFFQLLGFTPTRVLQTLLLPIILKHYDLNIIIKKMKNKFILQKRAQNACELINLVKNIFLISHIFACFWILTAEVSLQLELKYSLYYNNVNLPPQTNWLVLMNIQGESWAVQYLYSFYFIVVTMNTVGYGDVRPTNPFEIAVCIFLMMTCCLIFGFTINQIGQIFQDIFSKEKNILQKRFIIGNYMQRKDINPSTQKQIFEYLEYYWREELDENIEETQFILNQLSSNLKSELELESNKLILKDNKILRDHFSYEILTECLTMIQEQNCTPGEIVIDSTVGNQECYLYFIQQGELELFVNDSATNKSSQTTNSIKTLLKGDNFGQKQFFTGEKESLNVKSVNFSRLLKLKRNDFISILKSHQYEYEKFCMIKDKLMYSGSYAFLHDNCQSCGNQTHTEVQCPILHYIPKQFKILAENSISLPHEFRQPLTRKKKKKQNTKQLLNFNICRYFYFIEERFGEIDQYECQHLEYSFFDQNFSYSDLDEVNQQLMQNQFLQYHDNNSPTESRDKIKKKTLKYSSLKTIMQNYTKQKSAEDEQTELSTPNIQIITHQDHECESQKDKRCSLTKKDSRSFKKRSTLFNNLPSIFEQRESIDKLSPFLLEQQLFSSSSTNSRKSFINNLSSKDLQMQEMIIKIQKQHATLSSMENQVMQEMKDYQATPSAPLVGASVTGGVFSMKHLSPDLQMVVDFDILQGKFERFFNFKYYFPSFNCKNITDRVNDFYLGKKIGGKMSKKDNLHSSKARSRKRNSIIKIQKLLQLPKLNQSQSAQKNNDSFSTSILRISVSSQMDLPIDQAEEIKCNLNDESMMIFNEVKANETITPRINEEQVHLRGQPYEGKPKRSYLSDKTASNQLNNIGQSLPIIQSSNNNSKQLLSDKF